MNDTFMILHDSLSSNFIDATISEMFSTLCPYILTRLVILLFTNQYCL